jgi:hypothetical protein
VAISSTGQYIAVAQSFGAVYINQGFGQGGFAEQFGVPTATSWSSLAMSSNGQYVYATTLGGDVYKGVIVSAPTPAVPTLRPTLQPTIAGGPQLSYTWTQQTGASTSPANAWECIASSSTGQRLVAGGNQTPLYLNQVRSTYTVLYYFV